MVAKPGRRSFSRGMRLGWNSRPTGTRWKVAEGAGSRGGKHGGERGGGEKELPLHSATFTAANLVQQTSTMCEVLQALWSYLYNYTLFSQLDAVHLTMFKSYRSHFVGLNLQMSRVGKEYCLEVIRRCEPTDEGRKKKCLGIDGMYVIQTYSCSAMVANN